MEQEDAPSVPVMSTEEMVQYLALQRKKRAKVMRRVKRRCFKCWSVVCAGMVAIIAIIFGILLSIPPEYKLFNLTTIEPPPSRVLVFGASGATGQALITELLASDKVKMVTSLGRRKVIFPNVTGSGVSNEGGYTQHPKLKQVVVDFNSLNKSKEHFTGHDVVFWALGTTRLKAGSQGAFKKIDHDYTKWAAEICREKRIPHFILLTSIGADASSWLLYPKTKGVIEETVKALQFDRLSIFRPSLLIADRDERRMGEFIAQQVFPYISWTFGGSLRKYREIAVEKLAKAMVLTALHSVRLRHPAPKPELAPPFVETFESDEIQDIVDSYHNNMKRL